MWDKCENWLKNKQKNLDKKKHENSLELKSNK